MHTYWILFSAGIFISLIGFIWLTVVGFKRSVVWGLAVLLFSPIAAVIFAIANWYEAKKAFLVYAAAMVLMIGVAIGFFTTVGLPFLQIAQRLNNHELTREQADYQATYLFKTGHLPPKQESVDADSGKTDDKSAAVATAKTDDKSSVATTGKTDDNSGAVARGEKAKQKTRPVSKPSTNLASADKQADATSSADSQGGQHTVPPNINDVPPDPLQPQSTAGKQANLNTSPQNNEPASPPNIKDVAPDPLQQKSTVPAPRTVAVSLAKISHYLGRYFIITVKGGTEHRGLLRRVEKGRLILERKLYGGKFEYGVRKDKIKAIRMLTYIPDEKR